MEAQGLEEYRKSKVLQPGDMADIESRCHREISQQRLEFLNCDEARLAANLGH